jgi:hypothetical protein
MGHAVEQFYVSSNLSHFRQNRFLCVRDLLSLGAKAELACALLPLLLGEPPVISKSPSKRSRQRKGLGLQKRSLSFEEYIYMPSASRFDSLHDVRA